MYLTSSSNDRITIVDMLQSAPYISVLMFDPADDMDTGNYHCDIWYHSDQPFIIGTGTTVNTNLNIIGQVCLFINIILLSNHCSSP